MAEMIRVLNKNPFDVGVKKMDGLTSMNIRAGSFALMTVEDIQWINSICPLFERGILRLRKEDEHILSEMGTHVEENPNVLTDEEIRAELAKTARSIDKWLGGITEDYVKAHIAEIALEMDLAKSKLDVLRKYVKLEDHEE